MAKSSMPPMPEYDRPRNTSLRHAISSLSSFVMFAPLRLLNLVAVNGISVLRPYAPQLIPIVVCLALVPFAVCLSLAAGWMVWKSLVVGWEAPLFFQYGYVPRLFMNSNRREQLTFCGVANIYSHMHVRCYRQYKLRNLTMFPYP